MSIGLRRQFNFNEVLESGISGATSQFAVSKYGAKTFAKNAFLNHVEQQLVENEISDLSSGITAAIVAHQRFDLINLEAEALGSSLGTAVGASIEVKPTTRRANVSRANTNTSSNVNTPVSPDKLTHAQNNHYSNKLNQFGVFGGSKVTPNQLQADATLSKSVLPIDLSSAIDRRINSQPMQLLADISNSKEVAYFNAFMHAATMTPIYDIKSLYQHFSYHPISMAEAMAKLSLMALIDPASVSELARRGGYAYAQSQWHEWQTGNGLSRSNQLGHLVGHGLELIAPEIGLVTRETSLAGLMGRMGLFVSESIIPESMVDLHNLAHDAANATRLNAYLALRQGNILDESGNLTSYAVSQAQPALSKNSFLRNPNVVTKLTNDGSNIADWTKLTTPSLELSTGQRIQVHFYQNKMTGEINYNIDFKVKNKIYPFPRIPVQEPEVSAYSPRSYSN